MLKIFLLLIALFSVSGCGSTQKTVEKNSVNCPEEVTATDWTNGVLAEINVQLDFYSMLRKCLPESESMQSRIDMFAVTTLSRMGNLKKEHQKKFANFTLMVLLINAESGYSSSQHNYASLHNAEPGSVNYNLFPQDEATFIKWTYKAAAQKEPRALFNLAIRMYGKYNVDGITTNPETAYMIMAYIKNSYSGDKRLPKGMFTYIDGALTTISKKIGINKTKELNATFKEFDFSKLNSGFVIKQEKV